MSTIPVKIMLHGLIALAPVQGANDPNYISALLFDGRTPPTIIQCLDAQHQPRLEFPVSQEEQENCSDAGCVVENDTCKCTASLEGKRIWIDPQLSVGSQRLPSDSDESLANNHGVPSNKTAAASPFYIANLAKPPFNMKLDSKYLEHRMVENLLARMEFPVSALTACSLSKREDQGEAYVQAMSFRPIGARSEAGERSQALAQMILAQFKIDEAQKVTINMESLDDEGHVNVHSIVVAPHPEHGYMIELSNEAPPLGRGNPCDDGIARHFALLYEFAEKPPVWADRLIPHVGFIQSKRAKDINPDVCEDPTFNLQERPICPMASFLP